MLTEEVQQHFQSLNRTQVVLFGIETHVCVLQTCLDLIAADYNVHVVVDSVSSQRSHDRTVALHRMSQAGAYMTTVESVLFQLLRDSTHPCFKQISTLIKARNELGNEFQDDARL
jgi:isochorismate hydrolase